VPRPDDVTAAQKIVDTLRNERPQLVIGLGGSQQDAVEGGIHLGHSITVAVGEMVRRLRVPA
jgi:MerR family transcriptional regulator, light-induced transcriptional regulator